MISSGAIVPHAPVFLEEATPRPLAIQGLDRIARDGVCVVVSPHGSATGVYESATGDLAGFGFPSQHVDAHSPPEMRDAIAQAWGVPVLEGPVDHGIVVPLKLLGLKRALACSTTGDTAEAKRAGCALAEVLAELPDEVTLIASAHGPASVTPRAPLTELLEGKSLVSAIDDALRTDPARLLEIEDELWARSGACGAGPLAAFATAFAGRTIELLGATHPYGVAYLCAVTT